jgi:hypothetical protein
MKNSKSNKKKWLLVVGGVVLALIAVAAGYVLLHSGIGIDRNNLPKFVTANMVDLNKIYSVSKFRSGEGHDFSGNGETCRSMKHYFTPQYDPAAEEYMKQHNGLPQPPDGSDSDIAVFAPFDGAISEVAEEHTPIGKQVSLVPSSADSFRVRLFHIYLANGIGAGTQVKAGQRIGSLGAHQGTDVSVQIGQFPWNEEFVSVFQVMTDEAFAQFQARGVASRDTFIITKAYRDAHPLQCEGKPEERFIYPADYDYPFDDVPLSGYNGGPQRSNQKQPNNTPQNGENKPLQ